MTRDPGLLTLVIVVNGFLKVAIYGGGALYTFWRRRGMLTAGFALAAFISANRAIADAELATTDVAAIALMGTPCAGLIVASFIAAQRDVPRSRTWTY